MRLADGSYEIVNASSGLLLEDPVSSTANGALIEPYQANDDINRQ